MSLINRMIAELSRRSVIKVVGGYIVLVWVLAQGVADLFPAFGFPDWTVRAFVIVGILLIPVVFALAWRYDLTSAGVIKDPGQKSEPTPATVEP